MQAVEGVNGPVAGTLPRGVLITDARAGDWPAIWSFMGKIVAAGETFP
jgi:hypothetical protein